MQPASRQRLGKHTSEQAQWRHTPTVFSVWSALGNIRTVFSALSVPRLYNTSPLAIKKSFYLGSEVPGWLNKKWQEVFIVIWSASFCVEILCQETTKEDGES
jgi:hypothetical protein